MDGSHDGPTLSGDRSHAESVFVFACAIHTRRTSLVRFGATPRELFYLACSRTALAILGQGGTLAIDDAKSLVARAGSPDQFAADRRYISPRVLRMLGLNP